MTKKDTGIICKHTARRTKVDVIEAAQFILCFEIYALTTCALSPRQIATRALIPWVYHQGLYSARCILQSTNTYREC